MALFVQALIILLVSNYETLLSFQKIYLSSLHITFKSMPQNNLYVIILIFLYPAFILFSCYTIIYRNYFLTFYNICSSLLNVPFYFRSLLTASIKRFTPFHGIFHDIRMSIVLSISKKMVITKFNIIFFLDITFFDHIYIMLTHNMTVINMCRRAVKHLFYSIMLTLNVFHTMTHIMLFSVYHYDYCSTSTYYKVSQLYSYTHLFFITNIYLRDIIFHQLIFCMCKDVLSYKHLSMFIFHGFHMHKYSVIDLYYFLNITYIIKKYELNCTTFIVKKLFTINYSWIICFDMLIGFFNCSNIQQLLNIHHYNRDFMNEQYCVYNMYDHLYLLYYTRYTAITLYIITYNSKSFILLFNLDSLYLMFSGLFDFQLHSVKLAIIITMIFYFICLLYVVEWELPAPRVKIILNCNYVPAMRDLLHTGELISRSIVQHNWYNIRTLSAYTYYITGDLLVYAFSANIISPYICLKLIYIYLIQYSSIISNIHVYIIYIYMAICFYIYYNYLTYTLYDTWTSLALIIFSVMIVLTYDSYD